MKSETIWFTDPKIASMIQQLQQYSNASQGYTWHNDELRYKGCMYLIKQSNFKSTVLCELHASPTTGHFGFHKTYERIKCSFFWKGMKKEIHNFVGECDHCQWHKGEIVKNPGELQPLPIPPIVWTNISMDFIVGLPKYCNKSIIMIVVGHLSKYAHFCALQHPFKDSTVAQVFMDNILKLHGMPKYFVTDRDPTFTSNFWKELFRL